MVFKYAMHALLMMSVLFVLRSFATLSMRSTSSSSSLHSTRFFASLTPNVKSKTSKSPLPTPFSLAVPFSGFVLFKSYRLQGLLLLLRLFYRNQGKTIIILYTWFSQFSIGLLNGPAYCEPAKSNVSLPAENPTAFSRSPPIR